MAVTVVVHIVRHGETAENRSGVIQGQRDTVLNEEGRKQAGRVAERFVREGVRFEKAWTSDLRRAIETTEKILKKQPSAGKEVPMMKSEQIRERCMGKWEGETIQTRRKASKAEAEGEGFGVESVESVSRRAAEWWEDAIGGFVSQTQEQPNREQERGKEQERERHVLVVSHGYWISVLVRGLVGSGRVRAEEGVSMGRVGNTAVGMIVLDGEGRGVLRRFGDITHLGGEGEARNADAEVDESAPAPAPHV